MNERYNYANIVNEAYVLVSVFRVNPLCSVANKLHNGIHFRRASHVGILNFNTPANCHSLPEKQLQALFAVFPTVAFPHEFYVENPRCMEKSVIIESCLLKLHKELLNLQTQSKLLWLNCFYGGLSLTETTQSQHCDWSQVFH